jgi:hypothetical protein
VVCAGEEICAPSWARLHALLTLLAALRQHPLGEIEALLRLTQFIPQFGELVFENLHALGVRSFNPLLLQASVAALLQPLSPQPEPHGKSAVRHGMPRLADSKRNGDNIEAGQNDRDGKPD